MAYRRVTSRRITIMAPIVLFIVLITAWWATTAFTDIESWRLPSLLDTWNRGVAMTMNTSMQHMAALTALEALADFLVGTCVALPLAYLIYRSPLVSATVESFLGATQTLPAAVPAPLLVLWVGYGLWSVTALCVLTVFFPILASTVVGPHHLDIEVLEVAELNGASGQRMAFGVELPLAAPSILGGLCNGFTLSATGTVVGEAVMGDKSSGQVLVRTRSNVDTAGMFVAIILLCLVATAVYIFMYRLECTSKYTISE